jgi:hypothetical protein
MARARQRLIAGGSSLTPSGKLGIIMPPAINALSLLATVVYVGVACSWRFSCLPA